MQFLLLHSGGTIAMAQGPGGLRPQEGMLEAELIRQAPDLHFDSHIFRPLLDSAEVGPPEWNRMLDVIDAHPNHRVLLTHGTDTLAYSAAALARALVGRAAPVIFCAAMQPLGAGGDAEENLALAIATLRAPPPQLPRVSLALNGRILDGAGLIKTHSQAADAFVETPQAPLHAPARRRFGTGRYAIVTLSPGIDGVILAAMLAPLDGAVLRIFGAGTTMSRPDVIEALRRARQAGTRLRAVSQCLYGGLERGAYAAGEAFWGLGIEDGGTETPEAALMQLHLS